MIFPLVFASSVFVPVVDAARLAPGDCEGEPGDADRERRPLSRADRDTGIPGGALAWIFGLLAVFVPLCVWRYRRMS